MPFTSEPLGPWAVSLESIQKLEPGPVRLRGPYVRSGRPRFILTVSFDGIERFRIDTDAEGADAVLELQTVDNGEPMGALVRDANEARELRARVKELEGLISADR